MSSDYYHRAAWITGLSVASSMLGWTEDARSRRNSQQWMSILRRFSSLDTGARVHTPAQYDGSRPKPHLFHSVPGCFSRLIPHNIGYWNSFVKGALPEKRSYDNVKQGWHEAAEDEIALMKMTNGLSFYSALMFPDRAPEYEKYIDFLEATPEERRRFKRHLSCS